jgi:hypothetical protein
MKPFFWLGSGIIRESLVDLVYGLLLAAISAGYHVRVKSGFNSDLQNRTVCFSLASV